MLYSNRTGLQQAALPVTHSNPNDFTVVYMSGTTITVSGAPFTVADANCIISYVFVRASSKNETQLYVNGQGGVAITAAANVITIAGAGSPFASGDTYFVGILYQEKSYNAPSDSTEVSVGNPLYDHEAPSKVSVTNESDATSYYYLDLATYNHFSVQLSLTAGATDSCTATVEASTQDDGTAAGSCSYEDVTNDLFSVTNLTVAGGGGTVTDMWVDDTGVSGGYKYVRIKIVVTASGNDADYTLFMRKWYA